MFDRITQNIKIYRFLDLSAVYNLLLARLHYV